MKKIFAILICMILVAPAQDKLKVRVKDVTNIKGSKDYFAMGYGIVTGLKGTGDSDESLTQHTVNNLLKNLNIDIPEADIKANNLAAVLITARIKGGTQKGEYVSCTVSTLGDATSLLGGVLQMSPLMGTNGELIGVAQGQINVGGASFGEGGAGGQTVTKNVPTVATLVDAMEVARDVGSNDYLLKDEISFVLRHPDFKSAQSMTETINSLFTGSAIADTNKIVRVKVPQSFVQQGKIVDFISQVQGLSFETDRVARIVMNERTGTIIVGGGVKISECAITHGNIIVNVKSSLDVSQPSPFTRQGSGTTVLTEDVTAEVKEEKAKLFHLPNLGNVKELVESLNKLGVTPRDMMSIFAEMRKSGVLHAELVTQ